MTPLLSLSNVSSGYGPAKVLDDVTLSVDPGGIAAVVGANGAGKTTLLLTIAGHLPARHGRITFDGTDITRTPAHRMAERGIMMVPEGGRLFGFMTVQENLELGAYSPRGRPALRAGLDEVMTLFPILAERRTQLAGRLSGGERTMCAIARAMMAKPRLLMLDEPSLGLAPIMVERVLDRVQHLVKTAGLTVLLVEQNVGEALEMSDRAYVLDRGAITRTGAGRTLLHDPDVKRAYLGL
jgi:branched-chain amino acid transport system ATP-binding protein